ncbi:hypothetical protein V6R21_14810 [Limibacter armeniacum]|uniref:hypothetical protein n=1 Tax=Limibacter armeniacum TaxID=466084 RepID=UPI002FE56107
MGTIKKHSFLDLKIGAVGEYAMVIDLTELDKWRGLGWLTYQEVNLPDGDEEAFLVYGDLDKELQTLVFNSPPLLKDISQNEIIGKKVLDITTHLGTYGMGGAGFFGMLLDNFEYLTYAVWGAGDYVIINDRIVECNPEYYHKSRPWISDYGDNLSWDELTEYIKGGIIKSYLIKDDTCEIVVEKSTEEIKVEFVRNDKRLPRSRGRKRNAYKKGQIADYILFQHEDAVLVV